MGGNYISISTKSEHFSNITLKGEKSLPAHPNSRKVTNNTEIGNLAQRHNVSLSCKKRKTDELPQLKRMENAR